jgi:hypothetical protein
MSDDITDIKELLRLGFRLPEDHTHFTDQKKANAQHKGTPRASVRS